MSAAPLPPEDDFKARLDAGLWWKLLRRALALPRLMYPLGAMGVIIAACEASFIHVTRWVIDGVVRDGADAPFATYLGVYGGIVLIMCAGVWTFIWLAGNISNRLAHDIRAEGFAKLQSLEFAFYDQRPVGWLITRLTSDCDRLARIIAWGFLDILWGLSYLALIAGSLMLLNWRLGLIVIAIVPPLAVISKFFQKRLLLSARDIRRHNSHITAAFNESISGVRTTKTLGREAANLAEFRGLSTAMFHAAVKNAMQSSVYFPIVTTLGSLAAGLALWRGGIATAEGAMTLGTLVAFVNFATQFFYPIHQLAQRLTEMQGAQAAGERVMGLLATEPTIADASAVRDRVAATPPGSPTPDGGDALIDTVEFRGVDFAYATGEPILRDFNLTVRAGETVALVGPSGGGKSTLVSLVCRFYEPTAGQILLNGVDYRERPLAWFQAQLGIVLQTPHLFRGTVRENIRYGRLDATDAEVEGAAQLVNAHGFIAELEQGYDTPVGEAGNRLSTGQRQLLSFARALIARPQLFVMDEATSSIDTETEQLIQIGIERVLAGRISFVIAHRLSTIRRADRILLIQGGRIEEEGTHTELLRRGGHYYRLYTSQFGEERLTAALAGSA